MLLEQSIAGGEFGSFLPFLFSIQQNLWVHFGSGGPSPNRRSRPLP